MDLAEYQAMAAVEDRHWWYGGMRAITGALLERAYPHRCDLTILDAGCGTGGNAVFLQRYGQVTGIDLAAPALELGLARTSANLVRGSVTALPFAAEQFDLVTSFDVLYHLSVASDGAALAETRRVLRPDGRMIFRVPALELLRGKHDRAVHTRHRYTVAEMRAMLVAAGFVVEHVTYVNALLFPLALARRVLDRQVPALEHKESDVELPTGPVNEAFRWPMAAEAAWLARGGVFPVGVSVMGIARRNAL